MSDCSGVRTTGYWKGHPCGTPACYLFDGRWYCPSHFPVDAVLEENARLKAENHELLADKQRIDWMTSQNFNGSASVYLGGPWSYFCDVNRTVGRWKVQDMPALLGKRFDTPREAIDAAMKAAHADA